MRYIRKKGIPSPLYGLVGKGVSQLKNNIQRIIVMVVVVALLACFLVFPASAVGVDYNDLITNITVDGDKDLVTISVPFDNVWISCYFHDTGSEVNYPGNMFSQQLQGLSTYTFTITAFMSHALNVVDIPNGTLVTFDISQTISDVTPYNTPAWSSKVTYFDCDYDPVHIVTTDYGKESILEELSFEMTIDKAEDDLEMAKFALICSDFLPWYDCFFDLFVESIHLTFSISSLYRLQQQTGKTNEILSAVEKKLEENGQKLDDIVNGTPEQNEQIDNAVDEMQGAVDRLEQAGEAMNSIERPDMSDIDISIDSFVSQTSLLAYTSPILVFWENETLLAMVTMVATLVLVSWVFFGKKG